MAESADIIPATDPVPATTEQPATDYPYHPLATPELVQGIIKTESGGNPNAVNPDTGAVGLGQFLPDTAKAIGIDPRVPEQATEGVRRYISQLLTSTHGDLDKALAKYGGFVKKDPTNYINKVKQNTPSLTPATDAAEIPATDPATPEPTSPAPEAPPEAAPPTPWKPDLPALVQKYPNDPVIQGAKYLVDWNQYLTDSVSNAVQKLQVDPRDTLTGLAKMSTGGLAGNLVALGYAGIELGQKLVISPVVSGIIGKIIGKQPVNQQDFDTVWKEAQTVGQSVENYVWRAITDASRVGSGAPYDPTQPTPEPRGEAGQAAAQVMGAAMKPATDFSGHIRTVFGPNAGALAEWGTNLVASLAPLGKGVALHEVDIGGAKISLTTAQLKEFAPFLEKVRNNPEQVSAMARDATNQLDAIIGNLVGNPHTEVPKEGETNTQAIQRLLSAEEPTSVGQVLDLLSSNDQALPSERLLSAQLRRVDRGIDLSKVTVHSHSYEDLLAMRDTLIKPENREPIQPGQKLHSFFDPNTDSIHVWDEVAANPEALLHEVKHSVLYAALDAYDTFRTIGGKKYTLDEIAQIPDSPWQTLPPTTQLIMRKVEALSNHFDEVKPLLEQLANKATDSKVSSALNRAASGVGEYASMVDTNPYVITALRGMRIPRLEGSDILRINATPTGRLLQNFWKEYFQSFGPGDPIKAPTRHMEAINAVSDIIDHLDPWHRNPNRTLTSPGSPYRKEGVDLTPNEQKLRDAQSQILNLGQWATMQKISYLLQTVANHGEFVRRLNLMATNEHWRAFVSKNSTAMWRASKDIVEAVGVNHSYDKLSPTMRAIIGDPRNARDMFTAVRERLLAEGKTPKLLSGEDLTWAATNILGPDQLRILKAPQNLGGDVFNWFLSQANEYRSLKTQAYHEMARINTPYREADRHQRMNVMNSVVGWDGIWKNELIAQKLQWPTKDMLTQKGLTAEEADIYLARAKAMDYSMDIMNDIRVRNGQARLRSEPGFMWHTWEKPYRVFMKSIDKKTLDERVIHVKDFDTRFFANRYAQQIESGRLDTPQYQFRVDVDPNKRDAPPNLRYFRLNVNEPPVDSVMRSLQDTLGKTNSFDLNPEEMVAISKIENDFLQGGTSHMLERSGVKGYFGEEGIQKTFLDMVGMHGKTERLLNLDDKFFHQMAEYYGNSLFVHDVVRPALDHMSTPFEHGGLFGGMLDDAKELTWRMRQYASNFTGNNYDLLHKILTREIAWEPHDLFGLSPTILGDGVNFLKNSFALLKLRGNPGFYIGNIVQPAFTMQILHMVNAMMKAEGRDIVSPWASLAEVGTQFKKWEPEITGAIEWGTNNHVLEAQFTRELQATDVNAPMMENVFAFGHTMTGSKINPWIENFGRRNSFVLAYVHFRKAGFSVDDARTSAAQVMKLTMVDYMRESRPLMFQNFGIAGQALSPFQVYRNAYLGNLYMIMKFALQHPTQLSAYTPLFVSGLLYFATAGAVGVPLAAEYNAIVNSLNSWFGFSFPRLDELLRRAGAKPAAILGLLSTEISRIPYFGHGVYIGSSLNAPEIDQGIVASMLPFVKGIAEAARVSGKGALYATGLSDRAVTTEDVYKATQQFIPGSASPVRDLAVMPKGSDVVPSFEGMAGGYSRTPEDWHSLFWFGRRSTKEVMATATEGSVNRRDKLMTDFVENQIKTAADSVVGSSFSQGTYAAAQAAALRSLRIKSPEEFHQKVMENVMARYLTPAQRQQAQQTMRSIQMRMWREQQMRNY